MSGIGISESDLQTILSQWDKVPVYSLTRTAYFSVSPDGYSNVSGCQPKSFCKTSPYNSAWQKLEQRILTTNPSYPNFTPANINDDLTSDVASAENGWVGQIGWVFTPNIPLNMEGVSGIGIPSTEFTSRTDKTVNYSKYFKPFYSVIYGVTGAYTQEDIAFGDPAHGDPTHCYGYGMPDKNALGSCQYPTTTVGSPSSQNEGEYDAVNLTINLTSCTKDTCKEFCCWGRSPAMDFTYTMTQITGSPILEGYILSNDFATHPTIGPLLKPLVRYSPNVSNGILGDYVVTSDIYDATIDSLYQTVNYNNVYSGNYGVSTDPDGIYDDLKTFTKISDVVDFAPQFGYVTPYAPDVKPPWVTGSYVGSLLGMIFAPKAGLGVPSNTPVGCVPPSSTKDPLITCTYDKIPDPDDFIKYFLAPRLNYCLKPENFADPTCSALVGYAGSQLAGVQLDQNSGKAAIADYINNNQDTFNKYCSQNLYGPTKSQEQDNVLVNNGTCTILSVLAMNQPNTKQSIEDTVNKFCANTYPQCGDDKNGCNPLPAYETGKRSYFQIDGSLGNNATVNNNWMVGKTGNEICTNSGKQTLTYNTYNSATGTISGYDSKGFSPCASVEYITNKPSTDHPDPTRPNIQSYNCDDSSAFTTLDDAKSRIVTCYTDNPTQDEISILQMMAGPNPPDPNKVLYNRTFQPICGCTDGASGRYTAQLEAQGVDPQGIGYITGPDCRYALMPGCRDVSATDDQNWSWRKDPIPSCNFQFCDQSFNIDIGKVDCENEQEQDNPTCVLIRNLKNECNITTDICQCNTSKSPPMCVLALNKDAEGVFDCKDCSKCTSGSTPSPPSPSSTTFICNTDINPPTCMPDTTGTSTDTLEQCQSKCKSPSPSPTPSPKPSPSSGIDNIIVYSTIGFIIILIIGVAIWLMISGRGSKRK